MNIRRTAVKRFGDHHVDILNDRRFFFAGIFAGGQINLSGSGVGVFHPRKDVVHRACFGTFVVLMNGLLDFFERRDPAND